MQNQDSQTIYHKIGNNFFTSLFPNDNIAWIYSDETIRNYDSANQAIKYFHNYQQSIHIKHLVKYTDSLIEFTYNPQSEDISKVLNEFLDSKNYSIPEKLFVMFKCKDPSVIDNKFFVKGWDGKNNNFFIYIAKIFADTTAYNIFFELSQNPRTLEIIKSPSSNLFANFSTKSVKNGAFIDKYDANLNRALYFLKNQNIFNFFKPNLKGQNFLNVYFKQKFFHPNKTDLQNKTLYTLHNEQLFKVCLNFWNEFNKYVSASDYLKKDIRGKTALDYLVKLNDLPVILSLANKPELIPDITLFLQKSLKNNFFKNIASTNNFILPYIEHTLLNTDIIASSPDSTVISKDRKKFI